MEPTKITKSREDTANRIKLINRILTAYKAKKLSIQAQQAKLDAINNEAVCYEDLKDRMDKAYQKNRRKKKIDKLKAISTHWKGLN